MSITALLWVGRVVIPTITELDQCERAVLWALANRHNQDTGSLYPSVAMLMSETGFKDRKIRASIKSLEQKKVIKTVRRRAKGQYKNRSNIYIFRDLFKTAPHAKNLKTSWHDMQTNQGIYKTPVVPTSPFDIVTVAEPRQEPQTFEIEDSAAHGFGKVVRGKA